jgi:nucleoside-diphosphate-sugar epimerase
MPADSALVTGASGFIGIHLVNRLVSDGRRVIVLARSSSVLPEAWRYRVRVVRCDDLEQSNIGHLVDEPVGTVFHLAAYGVKPDERDFFEAMRIYVTFPATLAHLCAIWRANMVMAGTFSEYRRPSGNVLVSEDFPLEEGKLYGSSKAAGGLMASAVANSSSVGLRLLRLFKVYGAGEAAHRLLPALVAGLRRGERVSMSAGTQVLDFVHVDDVVEAMVRSDVHGRERGGVATWNVATGKGHSVQEFALSVALALNADTSLLGFGAIDMRKDDEPWFVGSLDRLRGQLGWQPSIGLDDGIRSSVSVLAAQAASEGSLS